MSIKFIRLLLLVIAATLATDYVYGTAEKADIEPMTKSRADLLDKAFRHIMQKHKMNTAGIAVIKNAELVWHDYYGMQSTGVPASKNTLFDVGSITKTVTAETLLRLAAQGKLSLDEPMTNYWLDPDLLSDSRHKTLTARMALSHRSGFMNWRFFEADRKLKFVNNPGEKFNYSGEGFAYLAKYVEKKLVADFESLAQKVTLAPLGIHSASLSVNEANFKRIARPLDADGQFYGYYCWPEGWCSKPGEFSAAGSMVITVEDYAKFLISSMQGIGLTAKIKEERNTIQGVEDKIDCAVNPDLLCPKKVGYGLGWNVTELEHNQLIGHRGSNWAVVSVAYYYQNSGDGVIIFLNAPNTAGIAGMVDMLELVDPDSPELHGYRMRRARTNP